MEIYYHSTLDSPDSIPCGQYLDWTLGNFPQDTDWTFQSEPGAAGTPMQSLNSGAAVYARSKVDFPGVSFFSLCMSFLENIQSPSLN